MYAFLLLVIQSNYSVDKQEFPMAGLSSEPVFQNSPGEIPAPLNVTFYFKHFSISKRKDWIVRICNIANLVKVVKTGDLKLLS